MAYVNYIREHTAFIEFASDKNLSGNERALWYALIHIANQRASGSNWPEDFISIPNSRLLGYVPFSENKIPELRNKLKQHGLIDFRTGDRNKRAPMYKMVYFSPELSTGSPQNGETCHRNKDNSGRNIGNNSGGNIGNNSGGNIGNLNVNLYGAKNQHGYGALSASLERVEDTWRRAWGKAAEDRDRDAFARMIAAGYPIDDIEDAVKKAQSNADENPLGYMFRLLEDWKRFGRPKRPTAHDGHMLRYTPEERAEIYKCAIVDIDQAIEM